MRKPNKRDSHVLPTPSAGGIVFVIFSYLMLFIAKAIRPEMIHIVLFSTPIALIALIDDRYDISKTLRYFIQLLTSILLLYGSQINHDISFLFNGFISNCLFILLVIAFTAIINFINFMDGIDGLVGGVMIVVFSYIAIVENYSYLWVLVGSILGFLFLNWHPSKIFMGDVGSVFLASIFLGFLSNSSSLKICLDYLLISSPLLVDALICVLRRFYAGQNIFNPHKEHLYQRLNKGGWGQSKVSFIYIMCSLLIAVSAYYGNLKITLTLFMLEIIIGYILDKYFAMKFLNKIS